MKDFKLEWRKKDYVAVIGVIDEYAKFQEIKSYVNSILFIDLKQVKRISSSGVALWVDAINYLSKTEIHYLNCSPPTIEQMSMVVGFMGKNAIVESLEARYICENCNVTQNYTLIVGYDILPGESRYHSAPERLCHQCSQKMELDHNPDSYFYFLTTLAKKKHN